MVSLRLTLALLSASTVVLVATITLTLALTAGLSALRAVGALHVTAVLDAAESSTSTFFKGATDSAMHVRNVSLTRDWAVPSDDPVAFEVFLQAALASWYSSASTSSTIVYFRDNTQIMVDDSADASLVAQGEYEVRLTRATSYAADYPNQTVWMERYAYSRANHRLSRNVTPPNAIGVRYTEERLWALFRNSTRNATTPVTFPVVAIFAHTGEILNFLPFIMPLHGSAGAMPFGFCVIAASTSTVRDFLRASRSTPGTVAFAYDGGGHLLGTSESTPFLSYHARTHPVGPGCSATADYATAFTRDFDHQVVCRRAVAEFPHPPLQELSVDARYRPLLFPVGKRMEVSRVGELDGRTYYVASARVRLAFAGTAVYLLLLVPEADVLGDVIASRNVAIGVACALVVLVAAANVMIVWRLLAPLGGIAGRMQRAATFEDDDDDESVSVMAEVAELQRAYYAMNAELNRIRTFVPQSVLVARKVERGADEDAADAHASNPDYEDNVPSVRTSNASRLSGLSSATGTLRSVSVVCGNVVGLHTQLSASDEGAAVSESVTAAAAVVQAAVGEQRGVVTFHGDRFLATFNTARPCAGHASKAARAAVSFAGKTIGPAALQLTAGAATGPCVVASMGSESMKTLSTVGPAVTNAAALERLTRDHGGVSVLATHALCAGSTTSVIARYVDIVMLPRLGKKPTRAVIVGELLPLPSRGDECPLSLGGNSSRGSDDELLYVLQGMANPHAAYNAVFDAIQVGDAVGALVAFDAATATPRAQPQPLDPPPRLIAMISALRRGSDEPLVSPMAWPDDAPPGHTP